MSKVVTAQVRCPKCNHVDPMDVWESINVGLSPEIKENVLTGKLFRHTCTSCGKEFLARYDCLYHDMEHRLMAFCLQSCEEDPFAALTARLGEDCLMGYQTRIVSDLPALVEKVRLREDGRDDRVTELVKYILRYQLDAEQTDDTLLYLGSMGNGMRFYHRKAEQEGYSFFVADDLYSDVYSRTYDRLCEKGELHMVDRNWADMEISKGILA